MTDPVAVLADIEGEGEQGEIILSPTVWQFVTSDVNVPILQGPRGEGKTVGGVSRILRVASINPAAQPLKGIVIRDTWVNLERTVIETLLEGVGRGWWDAEFHEGGSEVILNGGVAKLWCLGMDRPQDANKLQGLAGALGWVEEPAPAADLSSGVPVDVYGLLWSSIRQPGFPRSVQLTMNPPDVDHWTQKLDNTENLSVERFNIPPGENRHLPTGYREQMREALIQSGRGDLVARLVEGKVGDVVVGEAVINNFSRLQHVADEPLPIFPQLEVVRCWDSGTPNLHPAVVWMQPGPFGLNILGSRVATNLGTQEFIEDEVIPFQRRYFPAEATPVRSAKGFQKALHRAWRWRNIGDPSCLTPEGTSSQRTVALVIQEMLGGGFEPGPQDWDRVRQAMLALFLKAGKGDRKRFVQIDPTENEILIRGLGGRFHFPRDMATGRIQGTWTAAKRVSGLYCVDEHTEILTMAGWRTVEQLEEGLSVIGYDERLHALVDDKLSAIHRFPPSSMIEFSKRRSRFMFTPDHRCPIRLRWRNTQGIQTRYEVRPAQRLTGHCGLLASAPLTQRESTIPDRIVRILAWVVADGWIRRDRPEVLIGQSIVANPDLVACLDRLLDGCASRYVWPAASRLHGMVQWRISGDVANQIRALLGERKHIWKLVERLTAPQAAMFLREFALGDGEWPDKHTAPDVDAWPRRLCITQKEREIADGLQAIAALAGLRSSLRWNGGCYRIGIHARGDAFWLNTAQRRTVTARAWCPQTGTGYWVARRDGSVFITGNSHPVDALGYGCGVLYPPEDWVRKPPPPSRQERAPGGWLGR